MRIAKWLIPLVLAAIAAASASRLPSRLRGMHHSATVPTLRVEPGAFIVAIAAEHPLEGREDTPVILPEGSRGVKLAYVREDGVQVKVGDVIARLDTKDLVRVLDDARLAYSNAQAKIAQQARDRKSEIENARHAADQAKRELEVLEKSNATELETAGKELQHKRLLQDSARLDCERQQRLASPEIGLVSRQQVEQAERALRSADFAVTSAEKALEFTKQRQTSEIEQKKSDVATAEFKLQSAEQAERPASDSARYSIQSTKQRVERAQRDLHQATLKASAAGTLVLGTYWDYATRTARPFKVGDSGYSGMRVATISNLSRMQVRLPIEEAAIAPVRAGQEVLLTFDAVPGKTYHGKVESISPSARRYSPWEDPGLKTSARYFTVQVALPHPDAKLRPALKCKAQIVLKRLDRVLAVPLSALVRRGRDDYLFVRHPAGFALQRVATGGRNEEAVVIASGLRAGEVVALEDPTTAVER